MTPMIHAPKVGSDLGIFIHAFSLSFAQSSTQLLLYAQTKVKSNAVKAKTRCKATSLFNIRLLSTHRFC